MNKRPGIINKEYFKSRKLKFLNFLIFSLSICLLTGSCILGDDIEVIRQKAGLDHNYIVPGDTLSDKLNWLNENVMDRGSYIIEAPANESIYGQYLYYGGKTVTITLTGGNNEKIIDFDSTSGGSIFNISSGVTLILGNNITLTGFLDNWSALITVYGGGALIMNDGAKITGNSTQTSFGGGVRVYGSFVMNGGSIFGNKADYGGGVYINGSFTKNGGIIFGNNSNVAKTLGSAICIQINGGYRYRNNNVIDNLSYNSDTGAFNGHWEQWW